MNISQKLPYAMRHVDSIATHDDEELAVREAALTALREHIDAQLQAARERVATKVSTALKGNI